MTVTQNKEIDELTKETDYYKIFNLDKRSEVSDINKSYKKLAKKYHPDKYSNSDQKTKDEISKLFTKITTAYNTLKDSKSRVEYDYNQRLKLEYEKSIEKAKSFSGANTKNSGFTVSVNNSGQSKSKPEKKSTEEKNNEKKNEHAEKMFEQAMGKYKNGDVDAAILDMQTVIVLVPKTAKYHSTLGLLMEKKGWQAYAQAQFKMALNYNPKDKIALNHYQQKEGKPKENLETKTFSIQKYFKKLFHNLIKIMKVKINISIEK